MAEDRNRETFSYDPASIDFLLVTHAHLDHIGRIPKLVRDGFHGRIYSTPPTREIAELSLIDSLGVLEKETRGLALPTMYQAADVAEALSLWETRPYRETFALGPDLEVLIRDAGHILGSAMFEFNLRDPAGGGAAGTKIVFTGDLGNSPSLLLSDTETLAGVNYLVMESVYGDRNHESRERSRELLEDVIEDTMKAGGNLMIPAFSVERTQELIYEIEQMIEAGRVPPVPVFLDSPLAIKVTGIYKKYAAYFNEAAVKEQGLGDGLFRFPQLKTCLTTEESRAIAAVPGRKIIIAGSGMSNGGRILHHEKRYLTDPKSTLLLTGYQAAGSLGRRLEDGLRKVKILGETVEVRARVVSISGYSGHKGSDALVDFVSRTGDSLRQVFVTMGEPKSSLFLVQRLRDYLGLEAVMPAAGARMALEL